jgi:hypothetical protein
VSAAIMQQRVAFAVVVLASTLMLVQGCNPGFFPSGSTCLPCPANSWSPDGGPCIPCLPNQVSPPQSTRVDACVCNAPFAISKGQCLCLPPFEMSNGNCLCSAQFMLSNGNCACPPNTYSSSGSCVSCAPCASNASVVAACDGLSVTDVSTCRCNDGFVGDGRACEAVSVSSSGSEVPLLTVVFATVGGVVGLLMVGVVVVLYRRRASVGGNVREQAGAVQEAGAVQQVSPNTSNSSASFKTSNKLFRIF